MIGFIFWTLFYGILLAIIALLGVAAYLSRGVLFSKAANMEEWVTFKDEKLKSTYAKRQIPMETLLEAYIDEKVDFNEDIYKVLEKRDLYVNYSLTPSHYKFLLTRFLPESLNHSQAEDTRMVREHYDRGDDFFNWFLGDVMVYTSGFFKTVDGSEGLTKGQEQKMDLVAQKLQIKPGESHLDIGCGWGTFALHTAKHYDARSTGVTLSENQTAFGNERIKKAGCEDKAQIKCLDYRDIPNKKYKRISCLEMAEHVGVKNFLKFCRQVNGLMEDDGLFLLQVCGLRRAWQWRDIVWGLFMNKYIFPGADASTPLGFYVDKMEQAGFEVHSVENITYHYSLTIKLWYDNWMKNEKAVKDKYGERWFRLWAWFLAWSALIAKEGTAAVYQIVANKNTNEFDRRTWFGGYQSLGERKKDL